MKNIPPQYRLSEEFRDNDLKILLEERHPHSKGSEELKIYSNWGWVETMGITDESGNNIAWIPDFIKYPSGDGGGGYHICEDHIEELDFFYAYGTHGYIEALEYVLRTIRDNEPLPYLVPADEGNIGRIYKIEGSPYLIVIYGGSDHHIHTAYPVADLPKNLIPLEEGS
ncbi:MAG: hypothetical protein EU529_13225 [Promethearchaeota archaeon]|nr:MAG: hypothetical protein EU529_13225 [Candidatus Lokiarchaeota archaeon]